MKKIANLTLAALTVIATHSASFADVKIKQKVTVEGQGMEQTRMIKGARERRETKIVTSEEAGDLMPNIATITQCDLRRTLQVNDRKKLYTADPFGNDANTTDTTTKSEIRNPKSEIEKGGTVTMTFTVTDTGERKTMFGLTARHLKVLQIMESSADSCGGAGKSKMDIDGWYADFSADFNCPTDLPDAPPANKPDCRDRLIYKRSGTTKLGFLLDGTMKSFDTNGKVASTIRTETLEISRSPLNAAFFDVGKDYKLVSDSQELYAMPSMSEMMAMANGGSSSPTVSAPSKSSGKKSLGLDSFTGNSSKIDQNAIRQSMMQNLNGQGFAASLVNSPNEITNGRFDYVVGVEIVNAKQSKAGKIGGLFGKVTGNTDAAKAGDSEAEVVVTIYQKDGKSVVAQQPSKRKIAGTLDEAAAAAVENALDQLVGKIK